MLNVPGQLLVEVLKEGFAALALAVNGIDKLFAGLSVAERTQIKYFITNSNYDIREGYPNQPGKVPMFSVVLGSEQETEQPIGGTIEDAEEEDGFDEEYGTWMQGTYMILCMADNANVVAWMHALVKYLLLANRSLLDEFGYVNQRLAAGDLQPDAQYQPPYTFTRIAQWTATYLESYVETYGKVSGVNITVEAY